MAYLSPAAWIPKGVDSLEPAAESVVRSTENSLVVAGPGAGKTEILAQRACYLLETGTCPDPKRILAISFKRDAAKNLADRVEKRCDELARRFDSFTLDAFAKSLVDRFRSALPTEWRPEPQYEVLTKIPSVPEIRAWFESISVPTELRQPDFQSMGDSKIKANFELCVFGVPLPYAPETTNPLVRHFGLRWWQNQLKLPPGSPSLMFPMLNRLAAYLLRCNPRITSALRATYSYVFLDEFQDTTGAQYDVIQAGFLRSPSTLTAVGDSKQRIMLWAGAMEDAFEIYTRDFTATRHALIRNYRSAPELIRIQQVIAQSIESGTPPAEAGRIHTAAGTCFVAEFSSPEHEAEYLSELIRKGLSQEGLRPRDFCVLARQQTAQMVAILQQALCEKEVRLRDESELQDLLAEPMSQIVVAVLRLVTRPRDPEAWEFLNGEVARLFGLDPTQDGSELSAKVKSVLTPLRAAILGGHLSREALPALVVQHVGEPELRAYYRQYSNAKFFTDQVSKCGKALAAVNAPDLRNAVDEFIGVNILPAMTVHKSKGLEFHTAIFLGLEDSQLWNFANQSEEETRGFFVALSRAITRVIFTFSDVRDGRFGRKSQSRSGIRDLYTLLQAAGVETLNLRK
jgi:superfamily I DNA/RNA helicase